MFSLFVSQMQHLTSKTKSVKSCATALLLNLGPTKAFLQCMDVDKDIIPKLIIQIFDTIRMDHSIEIKSALGDILHTVVGNAEVHELDTEVCPV